MSEHQERGNHRMVDVFFENSPMRWSQQLSSMSPSPFNKDVVTAEPFWVDVSHE